MSPKKQRIRSVFDLVKWGNEGARDVLLIYSTYSIGPRYTSTSQSQHARLSGCHASSVTLAREDVASSREEGDEHGGGCFPRLRPASSLICLYVPVQIPSVETCALSRRLQRTFSRIWNIKWTSERVKIKRFTLSALGRYNYVETGIFVLLLGNKTLPRMMSCTNK